MSEVLEKDICTQTNDSQEEEIRDVSKFHSILDARNKAESKAYNAWLKQEVLAGRKQVSKTLEAIWRLGVQIEVVDPSVYD